MGSNLISLTLKNPANANLVVGARIFDIQLMHPSRILAAPARRD